jgi:hypothetical protein
MAHKSHKKHIKHVHQHEPATAKAKSPIVKAEIAQARLAGKARAGANGAKTAAKKAASKVAKKGGLVRRIARAAVAEEKKIIGGAKDAVVGRVVGAKDRVVGAKDRVAGVKNRVSRRVKSLFGGK